MDDGTGQAAQSAPARTRHWLHALLRRRFVKALMVANLVALLLLPVREAGWLQGLELSWYDTLVTFFAGSQESDRVVLVVTTEADINRFGYPIRDNDLSAVRKGKRAAPGARESENRIIKVLRPQGKILRARADDGSPESLDQISNPPDRRALVGK